MNTRPVSTTLCLLLAAMAHAQGTPQEKLDTQAPPPAAQPEAKSLPDGTLTKADDDSKWVLEFEPAAFYVAPGGKLRMPSSTTQGQKIEMESLNLDSPRVSPYLDFSLRKGRWGGTVSGFWFETSNDYATQNDAGQIGNITFASGDTLKSDFKFWSAQGEAFYRMVDNKVLNGADGEESLLVSLDVRFGARAYDVSTNIFSVGGVSSGQSTEDDQFFIEPIVGVKGSMDIYKSFTIDLETTVGIGPWGDSSTYSWDIVVGGVWRPIKNLGVLIGYRQLLFDLQNGSGAQEFDFQGAMAGVYAGVQLRF